MEAHSPILAKGQVAGAQSGRGHWTSSHYAPAFWPVSGSASADGEPTPASAHRPSTTLSRSPRRHPASAPAGSTSEEEL